MPLLLPRKAQAVHKSCILYSVCSICCSSAMSCIFIKCEPILILFQHMFLIILYLYIWFSLLRNRAIYCQHYLSDLSSCRPSCFECLMSWWWECGVVSMFDVRLVKSVTGLCPRFAHSMGHLPPFDFCRC